MRPSTTRRAWWLAVALVILVGLSMQFKRLSAGLLLLRPAAGRLFSSAGPGPASSAPAPDADGKYWIYGEGISAAFVPYGASLSNLIVNDQHGVPRDIVAGFDNASYYGVDPQHPHLNGVPGRYANRVKNSSFEIDGQTFHVTPNENPTAQNPAGVDTLHGGPDGWDWRNFTVESYTSDAISFSLVDPSGSQGFPGEVIAHISYSLDKMTWNFKMTAVSTERKTPIMLSQHTYFNLDAFSNPKTSSALNHSLYLPFSGQRVGVDSILIPTGDILANRPGSVNDFWSRPKQLGADMGNPDLKNNCGAGCTGYDTCYLVNRERKVDWGTRGPVAQLRSPWSGIQLDVYSQQDAIQVYSCNGLNGSLPLKNTQGLFDDPKFPRTIPKYGCVVLEVEDWIDGINHPEWMRHSKQIFGPRDHPYVLEASYRFSINTTESGY